MERREGWEEGGMRWEGVEEQRFADGALRKGGKFLPAAYDTLHQFYVVCAAKVNSLAN